MPLSILSAALALLPLQAPTSELEPAVREQAEAAAALPVEQLWERADSLRALAALSGEGLDPILDRYLARPEELSDAGILLLAAARVQGEELSAPESLVAAVEAVLVADDARAAAAAELLGRPVLRAVLSAEQRQSLGERLLAGSRDEIRPPAFRLACARSAYEIGTGVHKAAARREMLAFLASSDPELRAQGALALGAIGEPVLGELRTELERLAGLPGTRADLAAAYVKHEDIKRLKDDRYRRLDRELDKGLPTEELTAFNAVLRMVQELHLEGDKYDRKELTGLALDGLLRALDEHSSYLTPDAFTHFDQGLGGEYGGIGAFVGLDPNDGLFTITRPIYSGPAYRAGLATDDKIVQIEDWPTHDRGVSRPIDGIIQRLKGRPGTPVKLYVWRRGMDPDLIERPTPEMAVEVQREQIVIPHVRSEMLPGKIGTVHFQSFSRTATEDLEKALRELLDQGMRALVLDLRNDDGGFLDEAVEVANQFLPPGLRVVSTRGRAGIDQVLSTSRPPVLPSGMPIVVLVNRYSASAAEIVAGALQDHQRALLVGERTFGKGSVQQLRPLEGFQDDVFKDENENQRFDNWEELVVDQNGNGEFDFAPRVKLTIAEYLLPSGRSIHRQLDDEGRLVKGLEGGIEPDIEVPPSRIEAWRWEELNRISRTERRVSAYVDEHWDASRELFHDLALTDAKDASRYPDFEAFYASLSTVVPRDDVRRLVRTEIRRRVQDLLGKEFTGDWQEDVQMQTAVTKALEGLGENPAGIEAYFATFDALRAAELLKPVVAAADRGELAAMRARLAAARSGNGQLTKADLEHLLELLEQAERN